MARVERPPDGAEAALTPGQVRRALSESRAARSLGVTQGAVSQHLSVLRDAGLVSTHRDGRVLLHMRTGRAGLLLTSKEDADII